MLHRRVDGLHLCQCPCLRGIYTLYACIYFASTGRCLNAMGGMMAYTSANVLVSEVPTQNVVYIYIKVVSVESKDAIDLLMHFSLAF